jgi:hypothetical protein
MKESDMLLLAEGLMGNIPPLCRRAEMVFSGILEFPTAAERTFGLFVPPTLRPEHYNFVFSMDSCNKPEIIL